MSDEDIEKLEEELPEKTDEKIADEAEGEKEGRVADNTKEIIQMRLRQATKKHREREAILQARIAELESAGQPAAGANANSPAMPQGTEPNPQAAGNVPGNSIPAEMIPMIVERKRQADEFNKKIEDAMKQDEEFKKLATETGFKVPPEVLMNMQHLDNAPAVIKHLMKNKKANVLMLAELDEAAMANSIVPLIKFVNNVSDQLESVSSKPQRSSFSPAPDLSDAGDSGQDFDISAYVSSKR